MPITVTAVQVVGPAGSSPVTVTAPAQTVAVVVLPPAVSAGAGGFGASFGASFGG